MAEKMTKSEVLAHIAEKTGVTKKVAGEVVDALVELAYKEARHEFTIPGLGIIALSQRPARKMIMRFGPKAGQEIDVPAKKVLKFRYAKAAKEAILGVIESLHANGSTNGAAGIQLEDQEFPKKCGHLDNKELVSREDFIAKIRAASAARRSKDFCIIARTDSRAVVGFDEAITRARLALANGADATFVCGCAITRTIPIRPTRCQPADESWFPHPGPASWSLASGLLTNHAGPSFSRFRPCGRCSTVLPYELGRPSLFARLTYTE